MRFEKENAIRSKHCESFKWTFFLFFERKNINLNDQILMANCFSKILGSFYFKPSSYDDYDILRVFAITRNVVYFERFLNTTNSLPDL